MRVEGDGHPMGEGADRRSIEARPRSALEHARIVELAGRVARGLGEVSRRVGVHTHPVLAERIREVLSSHRPGLVMVELRSPAACRAALLAGDLRILLSDRDEAIDLAVRTRTPYVYPWLGQYPPLYAIADAFRPVYRSPLRAGLQQAVWAEAGERELWFAETVDQALALGARSVPKPGIRRVLRCDRADLVVPYGVSGAPDAAAEPHAEVTRLTDFPVDRLDAIVCCFCRDGERRGASRLSDIWGEVRGRVPVLVKACCVQFERWLDEIWSGCPAEAAASVQGMLLGDPRGPEDGWRHEIQRSFVLRDVMRETA